MGILVLLGTLMISLPSAAILGDVVSPSGGGRNTNNQYLQNAEAPPVSAFFSVSQSAYGGGMVREYTNSKGIVFAVTWVGMSPIRPEEYFGVHLAKYKSAVAKTAVSPRPGFRKSKVVISDDDFVHESFGHMGAVRGRAYVPSLVPAGVNLNEIK